MHLTYNRSFQRRSSQPLLGVILKKWNIKRQHKDNITHTHTHTHTRTRLTATQVSRYQKGKTNLDFTEIRDSEWQWHQLGHMQVCTSLQTDNCVSTSPLSFLQTGCPSCRPTNSVKALKTIYQLQSTIAEKRMHNAALLHTKFDAKHGRKTCNS